MRLNGLYGSIDLFVKIFQYLNLPVLSAFSMTQTTCPTLILYGTLGCHLCEHAKAILASCKETHFFEEKEVDIASSEVLVEQYGVRIPVVKDAKSSKELAWPFTKEAFAAWLQEMQKSVLALG
jgi:hypothetical protein